MFGRKTVKGQLTPAQREELIEEKGKLEKQIKTLKDSNVEIPHVIEAQYSNVLNKLNPNSLNAKKIMHGGFVYDSLAEVAFVKQLEALGLRRGKEFEVQQQFELVPAFKINYNKEGQNKREKIKSIQSITFTPDFVIFNRFVVDIKGYHISEEFNLKMKLLKNMYRENLEYFVIENKEKNKAFMLNLVAYMAEEFSSKEDMNNKFDN